MSEEDKLIRLYELLHGGIGSNCYWHYDEEEHAIACMKDEYECWRVTREELLFDYITKDM